MIRPIHPGLSPNVEKEDFLLALRRLFQITRYKNDDETKKLEQWFEKRYQANAFAFASGRGSLYAILSCMDIKKDDEILVTGFTCVAVIDAILAIGAKPVYVDIKKNFVLNVDDLEKKITKKSKAIIIQHTYGISNFSEKISKIAKLNKLFLIEDVAHGVGLGQKGILLGTKSDASLFSFGRDKAFSCVSGGMVITRNRELSKKIFLFQSQQQMSTSLWIFQNLFHTVMLYSIVLPLYDFFSIGKILLVFLQTLGFLAKPIDRDELQHFSSYSAKLSPTLAAIALLQLQRLHKFNFIREKHVRYYEKILHKYFPDMINTHGPLLRFPLLVDDPVSLKKFCRLQSVYLGDWYSNIIDPKGTDIEKLFYKKGSCPVAEDIARRIINLPTYPTLTENDARKVATILITYAKHQTNN